LFNGLNGKVNQCNKVTSRQLSLTSSMIQISTKKRFIVVKKSTPNVSKRDLVGLDLVTKTDTWHLTRYTVI